MAEEGSLDNITVCLEALNEILEDESKLKEFAKDTFEQEDADKNGYIDTTELASIVNGIREMASSVGLQGVEKVNEEIVKGILDAFDANEDGKLDPTEFEKFIKEILGEIRG